jgi:hypothetical protein
LLLCLQLDLLIDFVADHSVQFGHNLLVHLKIQLRIVYLNQKLRITAGHSSLDCTFNFEVQSLDLSGNEHELSKLLIEFTFGSDMEVWSMLLDHALSHFCNALMD